PRPRHPRSAPPHVRTRPPPTSRALGSRHASMGTPDHRHPQPGYRDRRQTRGLNFHATTILIPTGNCPSTHKALERVPGVVLPSEQAGITIVIDQVLMLPGTAFENLTESTEPRLGSPSARRTVRPVMTGTAATRP